MGSSRRPRDQRMPSVIMGQRRFFDPGEAFIVKHAQAPNSFARRQALVVVNHDRDGIADRFARGTDDGDIFLHRGIAELDFYAREAALGQIFRDFRRAFDAVISHCAVGRKRLFNTTKQPHERCPVTARKRIHNAMSIAESAMPTRPCVPSRRKRLARSCAEPGANEVVSVVSVAARLVTEAALGNG